jgi:hypothetical protein
MKNLKNKIKELKQLFISITAFMFGFFFLNAFVFSTGNLLQAFFAGVIIPPIAFMGYILQLFIPTVALFMIALIFLKKYWND